MNEHCQTVHSEQVNQENAAELPEKEEVDTELAEMEEIDTEMPETEDTSKIQGSTLVDELLSKTPKRSSRRSRKPKCPRSQILKQALDSAEIDQELKETKTKTTSASVWQCEFCEKRFKNKQSNLTRHILASHESRKFSCDFVGCEKSFTTNKALIEHQNAMHDLPNDTIEKISSTIMYFSQNLF